MASATAACCRNKTVEGNPVQAIPATPTAVTGNPQVAAPAEPPPSPPIYLRLLFRHRQSHGRHRIYLVRHDQILLYRLTAAALIIFVMMACIFFTLWLVLRPRLPELRIASVTISPLSTTYTNVSAACDVSILLTNANNKMTAFYDSFEVFLRYQRDKVFLSDLRVPPFTQPGNNNSFLHTRLQINNVHVGSDVVKALKVDLDHGRVSFGVKIFALVRLESKEWKTRSQLIKFYCPDIILGFPVSNGSGDLLTPFKKCEVALWIKT